MTDSRIRVMIVDDHEMVRNGLAVLLEAFDDLGLVGMATNGQEAIELCDRIETDVVLIDLAMPKVDGVTAIRTIRKHHPQIQFVAMISFGDDVRLKELMKVGAASYVLKSAPIDKVARAIRTAAGASLPRVVTPPQDTSPVLNNGELSNNRPHSPIVPQLSGAEA